MGERGHGQTGCEKDVNLSDKRLILASASPRRRKLLTELGLCFDVHPCPLTEPVVKPPEVAPAAWAEALAYFKARAIADRCPGHWVLGADTIVVCAGQLLGKPRDMNDARRMLELQAGRPTDVITGVCVVRSGESFRRILGHRVTVVWMRDAPEERRAYLESQDWRGKAGAYGIQNVGDRLIEHLEGSFSNVVGLPVGLVRRMLRHAAEC
jgi:septum formation protein